MRCPQCRQENPPIDGARGRQARTLERRAATSLAREGRRDEAGQALSEIYGRCTEGFETSALKDAKAVMEEI